ncbi:MAG: type II toxin-antitoxin system RelB/DinJ family antitoxin [Ruminiclostridium sp.]|nr:type II toxin-antitoxin system RelB/DinJ family antitoxin [Ruminiclostridium sp.]
MKSNIKEADSQEANAEKRQATEIYDKLGLDLSNAIRIFLKRSIAVKGFPVCMTLDNEESASDAEVMRISTGLMDKNDNVYK